MIGTVLWWSEIRGKGVVVDAHGNEYYLDSSVIEEKCIKKIKKDSFVSFTPHRNNGVLSVAQLEVPSSRREKTLIKQFEVEKVQLALPVGL